MRAPHCVRPRVANTRLAPRTPCFGLWLFLHRAVSAEIVIRDSASATIAAEHANAVQTFLQTGDDTEFWQFRGQSIIDAGGKRIPLLTDLDELERLGAVGVLSFESLYAKVG